MSVKRQTLNFSQYVPNNKILEKKVPENPRYKHVRAAVNSGKNVRRYIDSLKEQQKNANLRKDEVFKRIKVSAFVRLAVAVFTEIFNAEGSRDSEDMCQENSEKQNSNKPSAPNETLPPTAFCSVLMGIGELDLQNERKRLHVASKPRPEKELPYLLLDVRDKEDYMRCHIITAKNYPSAMLSRSLGYETRELQLYKNVPSELIILYDDDEVTAARVARTLVERGYENVFLLSGGLKLALEKFPQGLSTESVHTAFEKEQNFSMTIASPQKAVSKLKFSPEDIGILQEFLEQYFSSNRETDLHRSSCKSRSSNSKDNQSSLSTSRKTEHSTYNQSSAKGSTLSFQSSHLESVQSSRSATPSVSHLQMQAHTSKKWTAKPTKNPPWK